MLSWNDVLVRQLEHERKVKEVEQTYWMRVDSPAALPVKRWHWRLLNTVGGWLIAVGQRLQARVETAQQVVHTSQLTLDSNPPAARPCP
jgi:hypothetical protein